MKHLNLKKYGSKAKTAAKWAAGGFSTLCASAAMAIDTAGVQTSIDGAKDDALAVGDMVIGVVAALVVVGIVIAIVKKL